MSDIIKIEDNENEVADIIDGKFQTENKISDEILTEIATDIENSRDTITNSIGTIDTEHREIHKGNHFFYANTYEIAGSTTTNFILQTGAKEIHFTFALSSTVAGISYDTYEEVTANEDGTLVTPLNNYRESASATTVTIRLNPTGISTVGATLLRAIRSGNAGATAFQTSGNVDRGNEVIFKANTKYLLAITNLSASTNYINFDANWYEL